MLNYALKLAALGLYVFPLKPLSKEPACKWKDEATTDPDKVRALWRKYGNHCNIGIALGERTGIVGIDCDSNHGFDLEGELKNFPKTVTIRTKNGIHLYYKWSSKIISGITPLFGGTNNQAPAHIRSDGHYIVGQYSSVRHEDGTDWEYQSYQDPSGIDMGFGEWELAEFPLELLGSKNEIETPKTRTPTLYRPNERHDAAKRTAVALRKKGKGAEEIFQTLLERNQKDFNPPKENFDVEAKSLVDWVMENCEPNTLIETFSDPKSSHYILPLGYKDDCYFYTTSSNRQITSLKAKEHSKLGFLNLMGYEFWENKFGFVDEESAKVKISWDRVASQLMEACRLEGIFHDKKVRGLGLWQEEINNQKLLLFHQGDSLLIDGLEQDLNFLENKKHIYALKKSVRITAPPASVSDCNILLGAIDSFNWKDRAMGKLMAGATFIARGCGALPWTPMLWVSGSRGSGKSTLVEKIVLPILGELCVPVLSESTAAGIRQRLASDALPIVFDEAEPEDERAKKRLQTIMTTLVRPSSSPTQGAITKGTPRGEAHDFKASSMWMFFSIAEALSHQADVSRVSVLELLPANPESKEESFKKIALCTEEYGNKLFMRLVRNFPILLENIRILSNLVSLQCKDLRKGDQIGTLLAGYYGLISDSVISEQKAREIVAEFDVFIQDNHENEVPMHEECLNWLLSSQVTIKLDKETRIETIGSIISSLEADKNRSDRLDLLKTLVNHGLLYEDPLLIVQNTNPELKNLFRDTKFSGNWAKFLKKYPGALDKPKKRFAGPGPQRCVHVPIMKPKMFQK